MTAVTEPEPALRRRLARARPAVLTAVVVAVACLFAIGPFAYLISAAFKHSLVLFSYPPHWIEWPPYFGNFRYLLEHTAFLRWASNSLGVAAIVTIAKVLMDSMAGYAFARMRFPGRTLIMAVMATGIMVPTAVLIVPLYFLVKSLNIFDTYWALVLPPLANPVGVFIMWSYISALPPEIEQAARIDGCGPFQIYWRMVLPLAQRGLVVIATYTFLVQYGSFVWPLVGTQSSRLFVLTTGLSSLQPSLGATNWGVISAACVLSMIPIVVVFFGLQRLFRAAPAAAGLKG